MPDKYRQGKKEGGSLDEIVFSSSARHSPGGRARPLCLPLASGAVIQITKSADRRRGRNRNRGPCAPGKGCRKQAGRARQQHRDLAVAIEFWLRPRLRRLTWRVQVSLHPNPMPARQEHIPTIIRTGAGKGNRNPTVLPPADFESAASTSSAIPAFRTNRHVQHVHVRVNYTAPCACP